MERLIEAKKRTSEWEKIVGKQREQGERERRMKKGQSERERGRERSGEEDKHQARKGESPCNFSNPPGIYTFTRQIMKMKNKMENFPSRTGHRIFFFFFLLICCTAQLSMPQWVYAESVELSMCYYFTSW